MAVTCKDFKRVLLGPRAQLVLDSRSLINQMDSEPSIEIASGEVLIKIDPIEDEKLALDAYESLQGIFAGFMIPPSQQASLEREVNTLFSLRMAKDSFFRSDAKGLVQKKVAIDLPVDRERFTDEYLELLVRTRLFAMGTGHESNHEHMLDCFMTVLNFKLNQFGRARTAWPSLRSRYFSRSTIAPHLHRFREWRAELQKRWESGEVINDTKTEAHSLAHQLLGSEGIIEFHSKHINTRNMTELALSFPSLSENTPGTNPFAAEELDAWAASCDTATTDQQRTAVQFLLALVPLSRDWKVGEFDFRTHSRFGMQDIRTHSALGQNGRFLLLNILSVF